MLDIVGQILPTLQSGPYCQTAVVLVQSGLLLGTNLQPHLSFKLSQKSAEGHTVELLPMPGLRRRQQP